MNRYVIPIVVSLLCISTAAGQTFTLSTSSSDYQVTNVFGDVDFFAIDIEIDAPLAPGIYDNPAIVEVVYQVSGDLEPGTPSGFPAFNLQRTISGADFYAQGSALSFEIAQSVVLVDGVQVAELVGNSPVLRFNAREVDNGRFHPALLELDADGSGRLENSDNVPSLNPLVEVDFGEEYITDLMFDAGNTTLVAATNPGGGKSSSAGSIPEIALLVLAALFTTARRQRDPFLAQAALYRHAFTAARI